MIPGRIIRARKLALQTLLALAAGALLRAWFVHSFSQPYGDSIIYGNIAANWLRHGVYGYTTVAGSSQVVPTLIRLPGYPAFLAVVFSLFGIGNFHAVLWLQVAIDLGTCLLVAGFVRRALSPAAGRIALWLAVLCPFTANYTAVPLTEVLSIFCVALSLYAFLRLLESLHSGQSRSVWIWVPVLASAWSYGALLRPEGALMAVIFFIALIGYGRGIRGWGGAIRLAAACGALSVLPFVPWTIRNLRTFHLFQPLVPRSAEDPGGFTAHGFNRWTRTWMVEFASVEEIGWNVPGDPIDIHDLPSRAFDSPAEYEQTRQLFDEYNRTYRISPQMDAEFARLAGERIRAHPLRYYLELPALRLADMWLRPRLTMEDVPVRWWRYSDHRLATVGEGAYAVLNLLYLLAALVGAVFWKTARAPLFGAMLAYVLIRSLTLVSVGPEPRYTLEFFPIIFAFAALALDRMSLAHPGRAAVFPVPPSEAGRKIDHRCNRLQVQSQM